MDEQRPKNNEARTTALEVEPQRKKLGPRRKFMQEMFGAHRGLPALAPDPTPRADRPDGCPSEPFPTRDVRCRKACTQAPPPPHPTPSFSEQNQSLSTLSFLYYLCFCCFLLYHRQKLVSTKSRLHRYCCLQYQTQTQT